MIFDIFAQRYGLKTFEEFLENFTLREVLLILESVKKNDRRKLEQDAILRGIKLKPPMDPIKLTKKERARSNTDAALIKAKLMHKHREKVKKNGK